MPKGFSPRRASPDSLSRIRLKAGRSAAGDIAPILPHGDGVRLARGLRAAVLAHAEPREAPHHDVLLDDRDLLLHELAHRQLAVAYEGLLQQAVGSEVVLELPLRDL